MTNTDQINELGNQRILTELLCGGRQTMKTMNQKNAAEYVQRVGMSEARKSVHYATAKICKCGSCFCCEVFSAVRAAALRKPQP